MILQRSLQWKIIFSYIMQRESERNTGYRITYALYSAVIKYAAAKITVCETVLKPERFCFTKQG